MEVSDRQTFRDSNVFQKQNDGRHWKLTAESGNKFGVDMGRANVLEAFGYSA